MRAERILRTTVIVVAALTWGCGSEGESAAPRSDAGTSDASDASTYEPPLVTYPEEDSGAPFLLSQTGLYEDIARKKIAPDLLAFEPKYRLWSDAAEKRRWLRLPAGTVIDTSEMDHWQFPIGTMFFKEFSLNGKLLETRLIARTGPGTYDYWMGAFVWNDDESDAVFTRDGAQNVRGTAHDVPTVKNCGTCHNGEPGRSLGFSAVQQPTVKAALLSAPLASSFVVPGNEVTAAALGYLHANCAHCHNPNGSARPDTDMNLRLSVAGTRVEDTNTYRSAVGVDLQNFKDAGLTKRIVAGKPGESAVLFRMLQRGPETQMPPLATELVDEDGSGAVRSWIEGLE